MSQEPGSAPQKVSMSTGVSTGKTQVGGLDYNIAGLLCYVPIFFINLVASLVFLNTEPKDNRFLRFHAIQSLILFGASFGLFLVLGVVGGVLGLIPLLGMVIAVVNGGICWLLGMAVLVVNIIAGIKAYQGQMWRIPYIADFADQYVG